MAMSTTSTMAIPMGTFLYHNKHLLIEAEQGAIADSLALAQKGDWKQMSLDQKRAGGFFSFLSSYHIMTAYYIAYGPYGARTPSDTAFNVRVGVTGNPHSYLLSLSMSLYAFCY